MSKLLTQNLRTLHKIGAAVAASLDLEQVLTQVVEAAVSITKAEEGVLFLLDKATNELFARAQKSHTKSTAQTLRTMSRDSVVSLAIERGVAIRLGGEEIKLATGYLAKSLLCIPLISRGHTLGAICVYN